MHWDSKLSITIVDVYLLQVRIQNFKLRFLVRKKVQELTPLVSEEGSARYVSLDELIETADVISLHTPLTNETHHLLSDNEFSRMKHGVFIVNTARAAGQFNHMALLQL